MAGISEDKWRAAVGDEIADKTWLIRQVAGDLTVGTPDAIWAWELTQHESTILGRLQGVVRIRFKAKGEKPATVPSKTRREEYAEYLGSDHWRSLRQWALERADHRCQVCNTSELTLHVHHRTYERIGSELPGDLVVLCESCHAMFHSTGKLA